VIDASAGVTKDISQFYKLPLTLVSIASNLRNHLEIMGYKELLEKLSQRYYAPIYKAMNGTLLAGNQNREKRAHDCTHR